MKFWQYKNETTEENISRIVYTFAICAAVGLFMYHLIVG